jgi:hypothetical protein
MILPRTFSRCSRAPLALVRALIPSAGSGLFIYGTAPTWGGMKLDQCRAPGRNRRCTCSLLLAREP